MQVCLQFCLQYSQQCQQKSMACKLTCACRWRAPPPSFAAYSWKAAAECFVAPRFSGSPQRRAYSAPACVFSTCIRCSAYLNFPVMWRLGFLFTAAMLQCVPSVLVDWIHKIP